jgi:hypothetical protein
MNTVNQEQAYKAVWEPQFLAEAAPLHVKTQLERPPVLVGAPAAAEPEPEPAAGAAEPEAWPVDVAA